MKILVYDIAAEDGGGLAVLEDFLKGALEECPSQISWTAILSRPISISSPRLKVITLPWVKKSWVHRWWFEHLQLARLIRNEAPDLVISLQNTGLPCFSGPQYVFFHQALPFCSKRFSLLQKTERELAIRQKFISPIFRNSLKQASRIFVQTRWMKEAMEGWKPKKDCPVTVLQSRVTLPNITPAPATLPTFCYPARGEVYKNHSLLLAACGKLEAQGIRDYQVIFTLDGKENEYTARLKEQSAGLPIEFLGNLEREQLLSRLASSVLVFPSYLETCGLPLLEGRSLQIPILAADLPFAREGLEGYPFASFFPFDDAETLAQLMKEQIAHPFAHTGAKEASSSLPGLAKSMVDLFLSEREGEVE